MWCGEKLDVTFMTRVQNKCKKTKYKYSENKVKKITRGQNPQTLPPLPPGQEGGGHNMAAMLEYLALARPGHMAEYVMTTEKSPEVTQERAQSHIAT